MIDQPRNVATSPTVEVELLVQLENVDATIATPPLTFQPQFLATTRLRFGDTFTNVLNNPRIQRDRHPRVDAPTVNAGAGCTNPPRSRSGIF
jgi:hypothetical protein